MKSSQSRKQAGASAVRDEEQQLDTSADSQVASEAQRGVCCEGIKELSQDISGRAALITRVEKRKGKKGNRDVQAL